MTKPTPNQTPEQRARDAIDRQLIAAGWVVQDRDAIDFNAGRGIAVREYLTDVGEADYLLFVDRRPLGVIEAKPEDWGYRITVVEEQSSGYASARLKWFTNTTPLPFVYESTGVITRFTDGRDPKPRSREVFSVHRPETLAEWAAQVQSLRARLRNLPALIPDGLRDCQVQGITNLARIFRCLPDRPHGHARQPDLWVLPQERRQRVSARAGGRRWRERRQRGLRHRDRAHSARRGHQGGTGRRASRAAHRSRRRSGSCATVSPCGSGPSPSEFG